jgi:hypothetical protein
MAAYKRHYPKPAEHWLHLRAKDVQAYTHFSAPKGDTSGLGRFRGATTRTRAGSEPYEACGDDVLILVPEVSSSDSSRKPKQQQQQQQDTAPARVLYFFDHTPNKSISSNSSSSSSDEIVPAKWVAVQVFVTAVSAGKHVQDHWSSHYVYALQRSISVFPVTSILHHLNMVHRCTLDGSTACRTVKDSKGRAVWTHRLVDGEQQLYLGDGTHGVY